MTSPTVRVARAPGLPAAALNGSGGYLFVDGLGGAAAGTSGSTGAVPDAGALDLERCPRCIPSTACGNTCGECELCSGKSVEDLPPTCSGTGGGGAGGGGGEPSSPTYGCDGGQVVCAATGDLPERSLLLARLLLGVRDLLKDGV